MKIGIIRFSALGDIASIHPFLKALKYEPVIITTKVGKEYYKDEFNKIISLEGKTIFQVLKLVYILRKENFDAVLDFQCNDRSRFISKLLNTKIYNNEDIDVYNNSTFEIFNFICKKTNFFNDIDNSFVKKEKNYIVLNCGSSPKWISKRLPLKKWKEISIILKEKYDLPIYLIGDKSEIDYLNNLSISLEGKIKVLAGQTNLKELKNIIKNAYLTISTDSAAMHISATLKTPTIGIFGATNWLRSAPFGPWSTVIYDKSYFKNDLPLKINSLEVLDFYENIDISTGLEKINKYLR